MEYLILIAACFLIGVLTLLTGFGLGTLLPPFFALFFNVKLALLMVAIVHLANNLFKVVLFRRHIDTSVFRHFGIVSLVGALFGAALFGIVPTWWLKRLLGGYLVWAGASEFLPRIACHRFPRKLDLAGGFLSGLMGGILGTQGAIRAAYLLNYPLTKEAFVATGTAISILIDLSRIPLYLYSERIHFASVNSFFLAGALAAALAGTWAGKHLLRRISLHFFRRLLGLALVGMGIYFFF